MKIEAFLSGNGDEIGLRCDLDSMICIYAQDMPEIIIDGKRRASVKAPAFAELFDHSIVRPNANRETPRVKVASRRFGVEGTILWR